MMRDELDCTGCIPSLRASRRNVCNFRYSPTQSQAVFPMLQGFDGSLPKEIAYPFLFALLSYGVGCPRRLCISRWRACHSKRSPISLTSSKTSRKLLLDHGRPPRASLSHGVHVRLRIVDVRRQSFWTFPFYTHCETTAIMCSERPEWRKHLW